MAKKKPQAHVSSLSPEQAVELIQWQIDAGEKLPASHYMLDDIDAPVQHWRTVTDGILKRWDPSWASAFFNAQHLSAVRGGDRQGQIAKLRAFIDLLKIEIEHPVPQAGPESLPAPRAPTSIRVTGANARVNVNSVDNSSNNAVAVPPGFWAEFDAAVQRVPEAVREELARRANAMKDAHGKPSFRERWTDFMANAAIHITVFGASLFEKLGGLLS